MTHVETIAREIISTVPPERLKILTRTPLYRGERHAEKEFHIGSYTRNRSPKDNPKILQTKFDKALKSLGFKALRSNSIFATGGRTHAKEFTWGNPLGLRIIIPAGKMDITWSTEIRDLIFRNAIKDYEDLLIFDWDCMERNFRGKERLIEAILSSISFPSVRKIVGRRLDTICNDKGITDIEECLNKIDLKTLYEISREHPYMMDDFIDTLVSRSNKAIVECYEFNTESELFETFEKTDLERAIVSGNEISITGDFYYSMEEGFYMEEISPLLKKMVSERRVT